MIECSVKINNYEYKVKYLEEYDDRLMMEDEKYHCGITDFIKKEIYIREDLQEEVESSVLIHELVHAYIDSYGMLQVKWDDEIVADFVGAQMMNILESLEEIGLQKERQKRMEEEDSGGREAREDKRGNKEDKV